MAQAAATADDVDDDDDARDIFCCMRSLRAADFSCAAAMRNILGNKHHDSFPRGSFAGHVTVAAAAAAV